METMTKRHWAVLMMETGEFPYVYPGLWLCTEEQAEASLEEIMTQKMSLLDEGYEIDQQSVERTCRSRKFEYYDKDYDVLCGVQWIIFPVDLPR